MEQGGIITTANGCGCCDGIAQETPKALYNRSGLSAIAYRVGDHGQFKASLLARLHSSRQLALRDFRTRDDNDFTIALLDAFSAIADVLTFYNERIANEAYLRTATERRSVLELAALIGYQLRPGVAASAWLAFTIDDSPGAFGTALIAPTVAQVQPETPPPVIIDIGAKVQSVPAPGEQPQVYETVEKIEARAAWNGIRPRQRQPQQVSNAAGSYLLNGAITNLKNGDKILVIDAQGQKNVKTITNISVITDPVSNTSTTQIDLDSGTGFSAAPAPTLSPGSINDFTAGTPLTADTVKTIVGKKWDSAELIALANIQKWPLDQLTQEINLQTAEAGALVGDDVGVYAFRQRASVFGYNAPVWDALPANLRYDSFFKDSDPPNKPVKAAFPENWERFTLENRAAAHGGVRKVFLDNSYPAILPQSWIALHSASRQPEGHTLVAKLVSNTEIAHSDFSISGRVSELAIQSPTALRAFPIRKTTVLCQSEPLPLAQVAITHDVQDATLVLDRAYLDLAAGRTVVISGQRADLDSIAAAEVNTIDKATLEGGFTVIKLASSLAHTYKRATVYINANVAASTHGETVKPPEIVGSGDATEIFQAFPLRQPPLTYVSADTPSGTESTLEVRVNDMLWKEVPYFFSHGPEEQIYITRQDEAGNTTVTFGDGKTGARLPTGQQNIKAVYRRGIGSGGLVKANQLSQMTERPLGVRGANNPLPSTGAADPEKLEDARQNATLTIMTLDRIVSLADYQNFARAFAGIAKALGTWTWIREQRIVLLTVAGTNGATVPKDSKLYKSLWNAIKDFSEPNVTLRLYPHDPVFFRVDGIVTADPDYLLADVQQGVETALRNTFSFENREFGQPVHRSEVIATIQQVPGVVDVDLTQFYRSNQASPSLENDIPAAVPRSGEQDILGAQLVTLDPRPLDLQVTQ